MFEKVKIALNKANLYGNLCALHNAYRNNKNVEKWEQKTRKSALKAFWLSGGSNLEAQYALKMVNHELNNLAMTLIRQRGTEPANTFYECDIGEIAGNLGYADVAEAYKGVKAFFPGESEKLEMLEDMVELPLNIIVPRNVGIESGLPIVDYKTD